MLEIRNLSVEYPGNPVISELSCIIPPKTVTVIAGPNGCGKSTLLKAIAGILPGKGEILLSAEALNRLSPKQRAQKIACLPQSRQVPQITVERLVLHGRFPYLEYPRQYSRADHAAARAALETMGLTDLADRSLESLSGGQRQKAYIAMALAQDTQVVLLDEPTSFLDISHQLQLMALAKELAAKGKTVVAVLHDLTLALEHGDRLLVMDKGSILAEGTPEEVFRTDAIEKTFGIKPGRTRVDGKWKYFYL